MTDEEDMARDARSVACADAPGQDVWKGLADLELEHARSCVRQARQTNHRLLTNMRISRNSGSAECRVAMRPIAAFIRGERSAFMHRAWGHRNARNEWLEQAARSESEDTQPKATPSQADVGVQHVQKLHELDDEATSLQNVQRTYWANKGPTPLIETTFATHGHGYVVPRTDGMKVRCGGPAACERCAADKELLETARALRANTQSRPTQADVDALVKAMEALTEAYGAIHVSHGLDPEESPRYVAARAALTPFQKG